MKSSCPVGRGMGEVCALLALAQRSSPKDVCLELCVAGGTAEHLPRVVEGGETVRNAHVQMMQMIQPCTGGTPGARKMGT